MIPINDSSLSKTINPNPLSYNNNSPQILTDFSYAKVTIYQNMIYISGCHGMDAATYSLSKTGIQDDFMKAIPSSFTLETQIREAFKNLIYILKQHCRTSNIYNNNNNNNNSYRKFMNSYNNNDNDNEDINNPIYNLCSVTIILNQIEKSEIVKRLFIVMFTPSSDLLNTENELKLKLPTLRFIQSPTKLAYDADIEIDAIATIES